MNNLLIYLDNDNLLQSNIIILIVTYILIKIILMTNNCSYSNEQLCNNPEMVNYNGKNLYTCKNARKFNYSIFKSIYYYINVILLLIIFFINSISGYNLFTKYKIKGNELLFIINLVLVIITTIQIILWYYINKYCDPNNYNCILSVKTDYPFIKNVADYNNIYNNKYKKINIDCINDFSYKFLPVLVTLFDNLTYTFIILILIVLVIMIIFYLAF
jgi:hypothetical protein